MSDWIEDASNRLRAEKERRVRVAMHQMTHQSALHAIIPASLEALIQAVEKDIALFNLHFPEAMKRLNDVERIGEASFQVVRHYARAFFLKVMAEDYILKYVIQCGDEAGDDHLIEGKFSIALDGNGEIRIFRGGDLITFEEASKELIAPAI